MALSWACFLLQLFAIGFLLRQCSANPPCTDLVISIMAEASNEVFPTPANFNYSDPNAVDALVRNVGVNGPYPVQATSDTYQISARYCPSQVSIASRASTIQLLVHGVTYNKLYWSGLSYPFGYNGDAYSWIAYASSRGYPTLSIDRLGDGDSTHPEPITELQINLEEAVLHQLVLALKSGTAIVGQTFTNVIFVGHSYGSILGEYIAADYPSDIAAFMLTGFGSCLACAAAGLNQTILYPASEFSPRFSGLPLPYMVMSSEEGRRSYFYGPLGSYDEQLFLLDFQNEDDVGLGEIFSLNGGLKTASAYSGPVFMVTGAEDNVFCANAQCGTGPSSSPAMAASLFPKTSSFSYFEPANTGHSINLHYSAAQSFQAAFDFLASQGF